MTALPSTDRPLTAGDVVLLREGDVLAAGHTNFHTIGELVRYTGVSIKTEHLCFIKIEGKPGHYSPDTFTFIARPSRDAVSAASTSRPAPVPEAGEGVEPDAVFGYVFETLRNGAPGLSEITRIALARSVSMKVRAHPAPTDRVAVTELRVCVEALHGQGDTYRIGREDDLSLGTLRALLSAQPRAKGEG